MSARSSNGVRCSRRLRLTELASSRAANTKYKFEWSAPLKAIATLSHRFVRVRALRVRMECAAQGDCDYQRPVRKRETRLRVRMECAAQGDCDNLPESLTDYKSSSNGVRRSRRLRHELLDLALGCVATPSEWSAPLKAIATIHSSRKR